MNNVFWIVDSDITKPIVVVEHVMWVSLVVHTYFYGSRLQNVNYCPPLPFSSPESFILALCYLVPTPPIHEDENDCRDLDLLTRLHMVIASIVPEISRGFVGTLCG